MKYRRFDQPYYKKGGGVLLTEPGVGITNTCGRLHFLRYLSVLLILKQCLGLVTLRCRSDAELTQEQLDAAAA